jgi:hypothetical protein
MAVRPSKTFVYGNFKLYSTGGSSLLPEPPEPPPGYYQYAIEVLREFSASEFIGKLYAQQAGNWVPVSVYALSNYDWYDWFRKSRMLYFAMPGSQNWKVLHFRQESDDTGPYVAIALQYLEK